MPRRMAAWLCICLADMRPVYGPAWVVSTLLLCYPAFGLALAASKADAKADAKTCAKTCAKTYG